jgi:methionyl-tRNA synthetase
VNAKPHIGFAWELVISDCIARHYREVRKFDVWFLTGTDDNSLKNVQAAEKEGAPVAEYVNKMAKNFEDLDETLNISNNDFIRTAGDKHIEGAKKLWEACEKSGDIYKKTYEGLYCVGCEEFKREDDLENGCCPEHPNAKLEKIQEENYFFKLSKYQEFLEKLISTDQYKVYPESRKNEVLAFISRGLEDFSISRSKERAHGWGIPVPGDENQVIYVWFDALANYLTALDFGQEGKLYKKYWPADLHVIGKGITKFHAIYWPAILKSANVALPKGLLVHGYATSGGKKISKSLGNVVDPVELVEKYGVDPVRYFFLREVSPFSDLDFTFERFEARYNADLCNGLGNLLQRTLSMINKYGVEVSFPEDLSIDNKDRNDSIRDLVCAAIETYSFNEGLEIIWKIVDDCNAQIENDKPWELFKNEEHGKLDDSLNFVFENLCGISELLKPFLPETSEKMQKQLKTLEPEPLFPRLEK